MKKITILLTFLIIVNLLGIRNSCAQTSELIPDPDFNKTELPETLLTKKIKAQKHDGALVFNYANDIVLGNKLRKNFTIEIEEGGEYFLSAYVNAVYDVPTEPDPTMKDKKYPLQEISVYLNDEQLGNLDISKSGWCSSKLKKNKKLNLAPGQHEITFESEMPNTPNVDVIKLSTNYEKAVFDNKEYEKFLDKLKANMEKNKNNNRKIEQEEIDAEAEKESELKSASNSSSSWEVTPYSLSNPEGDYNHKMNVPVVYTYYKKIYFSSGTNVKFETFTNIPYTSTAVDPVMYLFMENNSSYAWSNDDGGPGFQSKIEVTIPSSGYYYLVVRAYSSSYASSSTGMQGVVDIYKNGSLYQDDALVSGYMMSCYTNNEGNLNYFTAYSTGTPMLWISSTGSTGPLKFIGKRYWYVPPMDYNWFDDARIRLSKSGDSYMSIYQLVSSEYAWYVYWGNCDLYGSCKQASSNYGFTNLQVNDAIISGQDEDNYTYNCASWAGGLTNGWFWGVLYDQQYWTQIIGLTFYGDADPQNYDTWEAYFMNDPFPRYTGALYYSGYGANSTNGDIALWRKSNDEITHFSVRREGNKHPHGYDWESKPGYSRRIFHPRDALNSTAYGQIASYFQEVSAPIIKSGNLISNDAKIHSFEESVELGLTVEQKVFLTEEEEELLDNLNIRLKSSENKLETLFNNWQTKCKSEEYQHNSNPYVFFNNEECNKLAEFCIKNKESALPYLIGKTFENEGDSFQSQMTALLFSGITGKQYGELMTEVKEEWKLNNYNETGAYIAPSALANSKNYMKKVLANKYGSKSLEVKEEGLGNSYEQFNIYPNPMSVSTNIKLYLPEKSKITLAIYKDAKLIKFIENDKMLEKGEYFFRIDRRTMVSSGMYVCKLILNNQTFYRKILVL